MTPRPAALIATFLPRDSDDAVAVLDAFTPGRDGDLVELRLDALDDAEHAVDDLVNRAPVPVVATCRRASEGGRVARSERERLDLLARAAAAGATWIDVEHDVSADRVPQGARVIRSMHLATLPAHPAATVASLLATGADVVKLVVADTSARGVLTLLDLVRVHAGRLVAHVLATPSTRALSAALGAPFTYGLVRSRDGFAFALPTVRELREQGRVGDTSPSTRAFLLLGASVDGSVSPRMLRRAFAATGADRLALPWSCSDPVPALDAIERFGWAGAAVTLPHKETVLAELERRGAVIHASAREVGATNTALFEDGRWYAHNTDRGGLLDALREPPGVAVDGATALVLGAGGAARAAVRVAQDLGAHPLLWARDPEAAERVARALDAEAVGDLDAALVRAPRLVLDATPAGPAGTAPLVDPMRLSADAVVVDLLVSSRPTALIAAAQRAGRATRDGLSMLAFQAARQVGLLGDVLPDGALLRRTGADALSRADRSVLLIGLPATGKTTLGRALATRLGLPFVDTDDRVTERTGRSPDAWIEGGDEALFRAAEREVLDELADAAPSVIATGGGAVLHREAVARLAARSVVVRLDAPDAALVARLAAAPRAALGPGSVAEDLARRRRDRDAAARALAEVSIDTAALGPAAAVDAVADHVLGLAPAAIGARLRRRDAPGPL